MNKPVHRSAYSSPKCKLPSKGDFAVQVDGKTEVTLSAKNQAQAEHRARLLFPRRDIQVIQVW